MSKYLDIVEQLVGEKPRTEDHAVSMIHSRLRDLGEDDYDEIDDLELLTDILKIHEGKDKADICEDPWDRIGGLIEPDEWLDIEEFDQLITAAEDLGWKVIARKRYYSFKLGKRVIFNISGIRKLSSNQMNNSHSCSIIINKITDEDHFDLLVDRYNLSKYMDRRWKLVSRNRSYNYLEMWGRYFFFDEILDIAQNIVHKI